MSTSTSSINNNDDHQHNIEEQTSHQQRWGNILLDAVDRGDVATVQEAVLERGADVNVISSYPASRQRGSSTPRTPLLSACQRGLDEIVRILLDAGANARWSRDGYSPILEACCKGHLSTVKLLIDHDHGLLEISNKFGKTPLFKAIAYKRSDMVRFLLDCGANIHSVGPDGRTALVDAAYNQRGLDLELIQILLAAGADVAECDEKQQTALYFAVRNGEADHVKLLVDNGANVEATATNGITTLMVACERGRPDVVRVLLAAGADVEARDGVQQTALHYAVGEGDIEVIQMLLDCGANVHAASHDGRTTLMHASRNGNLKVVRLLLAAGADVEARDARRKTALHYAKTPVMRVLILEHNANMFAVCKHGTTPFDIKKICPVDSQDYIRDGAASLLEIYGSKIDRDEGRRALHSILCAAKYSVVEVRRFQRPLNHLLQMRLPLGTLTLQHWRFLLWHFDLELIRNRDDSGKLPIHIACQTNAPVEILSSLVDLDSATLQIGDHNGSLPLHECCKDAVDYNSVLYLIEQGGVGTLAARNHQGALPLHILCASTNPSLRTVQFFMRSFPESVSLRTNAGQYPFMVAASDSSSASLTLVYELVRANPSVAVPR